MDLFGLKPHFVKASNTKKPLLSKKLIIKGDRYKGRCCLLSLIIQNEITLCYEDTLLFLIKTCDLSLILDKELNKWLYCARTRENDAHW